MDDVEAVSARGGVAQADAQLADVGFGGMELAPLADSLWEQVCGFMCLHAYVRTYVHICVHNMCVHVDDCVHQGVVHTMCTLRVMALHIGHSVKMGDCTSLHICKMHFTTPFSPPCVSAFFASLLHSPSLLCPQGHGLLLLQWTFSPLVWPDSQIGTRVAKLAACVYAKVCARACVCECMYTVKWLVAHLASGACMGTLVTFGYI